MGLFDIWLSSFSLSVSFSYMKMIEAMKIGISTVSRCTRKCKLLLANCSIYFYYPCKCLRE